MKHPFAVAEVNGWTKALMDAYQADLISVEAAEFLASQSGEYVRQLLSGEAIDIDGKQIKLCDLTIDDEMVEQSLNDHYYKTTGTANSEPQGYKE